mgnify:FL=1
MSKDKIKNNTYDKKLCDKKMTFDECESVILRSAVDDINEKTESKKTSNVDIKKLIGVVEDFIRKKKLICYGGTAINNILPKYAQFYNVETTIPDYDCYSPNPIEDAKELANIYHQNGYKDIEAKSSAHFGTFKVFVNFIAVADITYINEEIYKNISKNTVKIDGIHYAPPDYLRLSMYSELSRPKGDIDRWEKVLPRLQLLNKYYPLPKTTCEEKDFVNKRNIPSELNELIRNTLINNGAVFFGGYASLLYSKFMNDEEKNLIKSIPDFDVLCENPQKTINILSEQLKANKQKTKIIFHKGIEKILPPHYELKVNNKSLVFAYEPIACHNYHIIKKDGQEINVATVETILSFYLLFISINLECYNKNRLLCMSNFLFTTFEENKQKNKGLFKRYPLNCIGKQKSRGDLRTEKAQKYKEFKNRHVSPNSKEYEMWFLKYTPFKKKSKSRKFKPNHFNKTRKNKESGLTLAKLENSFLF